MPDFAELHAVNAKQSRGWRVIFPGTRTAVDGNPGMGATHRFSLSGYCTQ